ncbi:MAG: nucleotidyltransferase family protein [Minisyncoccales bacterium]
MLTKKQLKILGIFQRKIDRKINWKELKELSSEKSSSVIQRAVKAFLEEELIYEEKIGTSKRYNLNLNNPKIFSYFEIYNLEKLPKKVIDILKEIEERISKYTSFYSIVIFGSYSSGEQKKDSDLDLAIFIENERKRKDVENVLKSMEIRSLIKIMGMLLMKKSF